jgi:hypothetical protein
MVCDVHPFTCFASALNCWAIPRCHPPLVVASTIAGWLLGLSLMYRHSGSAMITGTGMSPTRPVPLTIFED